MLLISYVFFFPLHFALIVFFIFHPIRLFFYFPSFLTFFLSLHFIFLCFIFSIFSSRSSLEYIYSYCVYGGQAWYRKLILFPFADPYSGAFAPPWNRVKNFFAAQKNWTTVLPAFNMKFYINVRSGP